ncbi:MAG: hypothetical protein ACFFBX_10850 [Promethearchaeota archaeon]
MDDISVYLRLWEELRRHAKKTIALIDKVNGWTVRVNAQEFSVEETFNHAVQAIFEDAGNWFLMDSTRFRPTQSHQKDLDRAINRMMEAIQAFSDKKLREPFTFQWGEQTTVEGAIQQNLFHAVGHFSQIRNWVGVNQRLQNVKVAKTYL